MDVGSTQSQSPIASLSISATRSAQTVHRNHGGSEAVLVSLGLQIDVSYSQRVVQDSLTSSFDTALRDAGLDLDVETLRALEDALLEFAGCVMVISHDRWFLDRIATHILAFEGDSHVEFFPGNYQEYEADKKKRLGEEAAKPKRIRYKPITR